MVLMCQERYFLSYVKFKKAKQVGAAKSNKEKKKCKLITLLKWQLQWQRVCQPLRIALRIWQRQGSGLRALWFFQAALRQRFYHRGARCPKRCESAVTSAADNMVWRVDHGFLSGQVQHGLGSRWPTATWIVVNHKHALNQEICMEEEICCF